MFPHSSQVQAWIMAVAAGVAYGSGEADRLPHVSTVSMRRSLDSGRVGRLRGLDAVPV